MADLHEFGLLLKLWFEGVKELQFLWLENRICHLLYLLARALLGDAAPKQDMNDIVDFLELLRRHSVLPLQVQAVEFGDREDYLEIRFSFPDLLKRDHITINIFLNAKELRDMVDLRPILNVRKLLADDILVFP